MRYGIISDIHGNLEALEVATEALSKEKIDRYMCLGDIVGYGTDPSPCIKRTRELCPVVVRGNHDAAASGTIDTRYFNEAARETIDWAREHITDSDVTFLRGLDLVYRNEHLTLVHGTLQEPEAFHYMFDKNAARATFALLENNVCFIGHSHVPGIFSCKNDKIEYSYKKKTKLAGDAKVIVNTGSIGQPRDGDPRLCFCIYDVERQLIELRRLSYDVKKTQEKILEAGLPSMLAYRLASGA